LIQIGGMGAVFFAIVKFLLKPIWTTLNNYATAYVNGQAAIDVRIRNLEKLVEEQARLTRTVESIKDEIAAQRKSHDNRWAFRKDIYCSTVKALFMVIYGYMRVLQCLPLLKDENAETRARGERMLKDAQTDLQLYGNEFMTNAVVAPLAMADDVASAVDAALKHTLQPVVLNGMDIDTKLLQMEIDRLTTLFGMITQAGRKDLWGTPEPEAKAGAAT
jgi:hypothetical protein